MKKGKNIEEFGQILNKGIEKRQKVQTAWCKVVSVDWDKKTMNATGINDDLPFYDVFLGLGSFYRRPKIDTKCLVGIIENQEASAFLVEAEAFDEAVWISGESELTIKQEGFIVKQGGESLKNVQNDLHKEIGKLCDELSKVVVSIGVTPNVPAITLIKNKIMIDINNRLNTILIA